MKTLITTSIALCAASLCGVASATMIQSATVLASSPSLHYKYLASNLVNQSGLSAGYTSGATDFDTYASQGPTHYGTSTGNGYYAAAPAFVDFDLGSTFQLTKFGLWNDNDSQGVKEFSLLVSDDSSFTNAMSVGSFVASFGPLGSATPIALQVFDTLDAAGRYVRLNFLTSYEGVGVNVGEVIFGVDNVQASVPEPGTGALIGLGLFGLAAWRRKYAVDRLN